MVDLLVQGRGLVPAVAYGLRSRRSSLRGKVVPFARGTVWLYRDPRQERSKITDFDVDRYALGIVGDLDAYYEASLWAEVVWRSHASGNDGDDVFQLFSEALGLLDEHPERSADLGTVVIWRYLEIMGLQPDLDYCSRSERTFVAEEPRYYDVHEGTVIGREWAEPHMVEIDGGVTRYLFQTHTRRLSDMLSLGLAEDSRNRARRLILAAIQEAIGVPLNTLKVSGVNPGLPRRR